MGAWPDAEQLLSDAIHYLMLKDKKESALLLLSCEIAYGDNPNEEEFDVFLSGPPEVYDALQPYPPDVDPFDDKSEVNRGYTEAWGAFEAVGPLRTKFTGFEVRMKFADIQPGWREKLLEEVHGRRVHNQGVAIQGSEIVEWGNMRFRSQTEVRIAKALDTVGVLFLPNCLARLRLNKGASRATQEADFLICQSGKWGILEADGGPYHQQAARDHDRDRLFRQHGIKVIERFTAEECYSDAPGVVRKFLTLLERNG